MPLPEQAPAARPISGKTVMSWHWLFARGFCVPAPWSPPWPEARDRAGSRIGENARPVDDLRVLRRGQRNLDHVDAEQRRVRIVLRRPNIP